MKPKLNIKELVVSIFKSFINIRLDDIIQNSGEIDLKKVPHLKENGNKKNI